MRAIDIGAPSPNDFSSTRRASGWEQTAWCATPGRTCPRRCGEHQFRGHPLCDRRAPDLRASGRKDGAWAPLGNSAWQPIVDNGYNRPRARWRGTTSATARPGRATANMRCACFGSRATGAIRQESTNDRSGHHRVRQALRTVFAPARSVRAMPGEDVADAELSETERSHAAALMSGTTSARFVPRRSTRPVDHVARPCGSATPCAKRRRGDPSTWRGPNAGSRNSVVARACSIRCGTAARSLPGWRPALRRALEPLAFAETERQVGSTSKASRHLCRRRIAARARSSSK